MDYLGIELELLDGIIIESPKKLLDGEMIVRVTMYSDELNVLCFSGVVRDVETGDSIVVNTGPEVVTSLKEDTRPQED